MGSSSGGVGRGWRAALGAALVVLVLVAAGPAVALGQVAADQATGAGPRPERPRDAPPVTDVVGGSPAPFVAHQALVLPVFGDDVTACGGSVIHPGWVLTAAHCVDGPGLTGVAVALGIVDQSRLSDLQVVPPASVRQHPGYDPLTKDHDVALLRLPRGTRAAPVGVALATDVGPDVGTVHTPGNDYVVTGWGRTSEGGPTPRYLRFAVVPLLDDATCGDPAVYGSRFHAATMVCAGDIAGGVDTCQGDSGGPLWDPAGNRQVGITSWGEGCARPLRPGVYTRVAAEHDWIRSHVGRPPNDDVAAAAPLACPVGAAHQATAFATGEAGEPPHAGSAPDSSVWFTITPPASGTLALTTLGSTYDTTLGVYTGTGPAGLVEVASNDQLPSGGRDESAVALPVAGGATYRIAVDGYSRAQGNVQLDWLLDVPGRPLFADVGTGHRFAAAIRSVAEDAVTTGYPDCTFRPGSFVTRGAMAAFLFRLAGWPTGSFLPAGFPDVPSGYDFAREVAWLAGTGITTGYGDGTFRPGATVSRQAVAAFLHRLAGSPPVTIPGPAGRFTDVGPGHPFDDAIYWMAAAGMSSGYADGSFRPTAPVSRQAMAAFLAGFPG